MQVKKGYENLMVLIVALAFGFVMFDRFALTNMAPFILPDLGIDAAQFGIIISAFSFTWAIVGFLGSMWSDMKENKRKALAFFVFMFSILSLLTGFAAGFVSLLIIRVIMGIFEGPIYPLNTSFLLAQSSPKRRGLNIGLMGTTSVGLISSLAGPLIVVALAQLLGWRVTFFLTIIPGLIVASLVMKCLHEPDMIAVEATAFKGDRKGQFREVMKNRNMIVGVLFSICQIGWYVVMASFTPMFLTNVRGMDPTTMSIVMSALGVGGIVWGMAVPALSDRFGRKPIVIIFGFLSAATPLAFLFAPVDNLPLMMFLGFVGWCGAGNIAVMLGTIPSESINPKFASTAVATVQGLGELIGGVVGASLAGFLSVKYGYSAAMWLSVGYMIVGGLIAFGYYETAPVVLARKAAKQAELI